ncbi:LEAF RUST 10 DISEASE-RESISTANCE LOCUS RECEPTOR-LIKE PROTEIN KINASE-like 2.5 isoform X2 [Cajanus cajan]|uniref:LEAF RUST 10 DISEASE-RESISTANCE LOCUS RECEPTOR-LIKE PROTEIN KINASE-like 2.5 isoform X2 n=1 Tax=Cajanus cajan TaxID=3821 RepID=UPI00098DAD14|nr:LEAF RUST 10 DISEASE-RESISTANCE LOCUS RECEPTOR-LIKE PROTEIN KINASE-like 2.5 isoform X2 [Cajanus cajan]
MMFEFEMRGMRVFHILTSVLTICCFFLITLPQSRCQTHDAVCNEQPYKCGTLSNISYPFWGQNRSRQCGFSDQFELTCHDDDTTTSIRIGSQNFTVKELNTSAETMRLVRKDLADDVCSPQFGDTYDVNSSTVFRYSSSVYNMTIFYNCSSSVDTPTGFGNLTCGDEKGLFSNGAQDEVLKRFAWLERCGRHVRVPIDAPYDDKGGRQFLQQAFGSGFPVNYTLHTSLTSAGVPPSQIILLVLGGLMTCIVIYCCSCKCMSSTLKFWSSRKNDREIEAFLKNYGALAHQRYKFSEIKKMTNSFKDKLGEGGFGAVYKGELLSGCPVAVKILNASKGNGEDFINEVASISRTSHINVVTLLGFCCEGHKKALIYEFMHNGSLEKFIYNKGLEATPSLSWDNLWEIALGIARGLEYLHRGCNTRILHFDIKPHNILLDEDFCPKISDFGLAKLCSRKESIVSMPDARGTIGYVAPEVWNRNFGGVSHKSDVYSYGMMLLEMVGGRKNINAEANHTSEIYFPHWVYSRLEQGGDLRPDKVIATEENEIARRMTIVGLWCVQTFPRDRPTISRVIDMLEDNMNSLEMPPKPVLSSPTRSVPESTTSSLQFE